MEINKVYINERNYPSLLREIDSPPNPLFYVGDLQLASRRSVAVVGSRRATDYGCWAAERLGKQLAGSGMTVVSGMAKGIDACAHRGALSAGTGRQAGRTIAVLGCGIDICYPPSNRKLRDEIAADALIVSEYPAGTPPAKYRFPQRNRIISGLSEATVVVQAGDRSGALITAELAADQGRSVYAVPGNINSAYNLGSNKLLRDGAMPLIVLEDILEDLGLHSAKTEIFQKNLGKDEKAVFSLLEEMGEMTIDQLCSATKQPPSFIGGIVTILEMKGVICTSMGKIFIAK